MHLFNIIKFILPKEYRMANTIISFEYPTLLANIIEKNINKPACIINNATINVIILYLKSFLS